MPHLTSNIILSLGTGFWVLQTPPAKSMPPSYPRLTRVLYCPPMSASPKECPSIQTVTGKADLENQWATAGEAIEVVNLISNNTEKGISFVLSWPKMLLNTQAGTVCKWPVRSWLSIQVLFPRLEKPMCAVAFLKAHLLQRCWQKGGGRENNVTCFHQEASDHFPLSLRLFGRFWSNLLWWEETLNIKKKKNPTFIFLLRNGILFLDDKGFGRPWCGIWLILSQLLNISRLHIQSIEIALKISAKGRV